MKSTQQKIKLLIIALAIGVCCGANLHAQTPADDPGGPGSGSGGGTPGGDGSPIVPFDKDMSAIFLLTGIAYAATRLKKNTVVSLN